ncbi:MAG: nitroreductase/quinone reductase family protein [Dehalococcoidia bacterium]
MAKTYRMNPLRRTFNGLMRALSRFGVGPPVLVTRGRRSGREHRVPVAPLDFDGQRWLVSPYGQSEWVRNVRANGEAALERRGGREPLHLEEITDAQTAAPVLQRYYAKNPITHPYFETSDGTSVEGFRAEAAQHPVLRARAKVAAEPGGAS